MPLRSYVPPEGFARVEDTVALVTDEDSDRCGELAKVRMHNRSEHLYSLGFTGGGSAAVRDDDPRKVRVFLRPDRHPAVEADWKRHGRNSAALVEAYNGFGSLGDLGARYRALFGEDFVPSV